MSQPEHRRVAEILLADPLLRDAFERARSLELPQWRLVSGALYNTIWNHLTGKPSGHGIKDIDLVYFDDRDLSYEAEDAVIARAAEAFSGFPHPVEIRNQARVHLWYFERFGAAYPRLRSADESLRYYASKHHAIAARLEADGRLDIHAPFGLADILALRAVPNRILDNRETHVAKAARCKALWPELTVEAW